MVFKNKIIKQKTSEKNNTNINNRKQNIILISDDRELRVALSGNCVWHCQVIGCGILVELVVAF